MWLEAIVPAADLEHLLLDLTPATIDLKGDGELVLEKPTEVALVPGRGLRVTCAARLRWVVLGIHVPVTAEAVTVLLEPEVIHAPGKRDALAFHIVIEHLGVTAVPGLLTEVAMEKINTELGRPRARLLWEFSESLSRRLALPDLIQPPRSLDLQVGWGDVRITTDAFVLAVSIHVRGAAPLLAARTPLPRVGAGTPALRATPASLVTAALTGISVGALGVALGLFLARRRDARVGLLALLR